jgi:hypothetical protein
MHVVGAEVQDCKGTHMMLLGHWVHTFPLEVVWQEIRNLELQSDLQAETWKASGLTHCISSGPIVTVHYIVLLVGAPF